MANRIVQLPNVQGCFLVYGARYADQRGYFEELYNESKFEKPITESRWKQVSMAKSVPNALRGLHCSNYAKYVTCLRGEVYDVVVDLRPSSPTYLKWQGVWLNADDSENPCHLYVPRRCGHGYFCKRESLFLYMQDGTYNPAEDIEINVFDDTVNVEWPLPHSDVNNGAYIVSDKDRKSPLLAQVPELLEDRKLGSQYRDIVKPLGGKQREKWLVYGVNGFLGSYFIECLNRIKAVDSSEDSLVHYIDIVGGRARIENREDLLDEVDRVRPSRIVCMAGIAGRPDISWCEKNQPETIRINLIGQLNVVDVASSCLNSHRNIHVTLLTTGGIYTYDNDKHKVGDSEEAFVEEDEPNFVDKLFYYDLRVLQERLLKSYTSSAQVLALRIMYPSTRDLVNSPKSLLSKLVKFKQIKSVPISITILDDLYPVLLNMVAKRVQGKLFL
jgi:dTDP-4-dehydrorhamnose 3,5-epimerase